MKKIFNHLVGIFLFLFPLIFSAKLDDHFFLPKYLLFWLFLPLFIFTSLDFSRQKKAFSVNSLSLIEKFFLFFFIFSFLHLTIFFFWRKIQFQIYLFETSWLIWSLFLYLKKESLNYNLLNNYLLFSTLPLSLISILQYYGIYLLVPKWHIRGFEMSKHFNLIYGTLGNPNYICNFLLPLLALTIYQYLKTGKKWLLFLTILQFLTIFLTYSRAGIINSIFILILEIAITIKLKIIHFTKKKLLSLSIIIIVILIIFSFPNPLNKGYSLNPIIKNLPERFFSPTGSIHKRLHLWKNTIYLIFKYPLGIGDGNFVKKFLDIQQEKFPLYSPAEKAFWTYAKRAHNCFLEKLVNKGILGGLLFLILNILLLIESYRKKIFLYFFPLLALLLQGIISFPLKLPASSFLYSFITISIIIKISQGR